jgi:hypothetical protein
LHYQVQNRKNGSKEENHQFLKNLIMVTVLLVCSSSVSEIRTFTSGLFFRLIYFYRLKQRYLEYIHPIKNKDSTDTVELFWPCVAVVPVVENRRHHRNRCWRSWSYRRPASRARALTTRP